MKLNKSQITKLKFFTLLNDKVQDVTVFFKNIALTSYAENIQGII